MSLGPIPWSKRRDYALWVELDRSLIDPFIEIIGRLDMWFLEHLAQEQTMKSQKHG